MSINDPTFVDLSRSLPTISSAGKACDTPQIKLMKFLSTFGFGGTERQVINLVRHLDRSRFDLSFGCMNRCGQFLGDIEQQQVPISEYRIKCLYMPNTIRQQLRLAMNLRREKIQISHTYNFYANTFAIPAARLAGVPVVIASIRDTGMCISSAKIRVHQLACRFADCVLVNAEAVRQWLTGQGYSAEKITVIRNGIDLSRFSRPVDSTGLRRELGLPECAPLVVVLARLAPQKGIETFMEAAVTVSERCPDVRFLIVGDIFFSIPRGDGVVEPDAAYQQAYQQKLFQYADRLGLSERIVFTGYRSDIPELLSQATVSVLPSHSGEGLSNSLLESMAAGVAVIATDVGGNAEAIGEHGRTGLLVPPRDPGTLAQAICAVLNDRHLARRLGYEAKQRVTENFSLERMVRETENLYITLLERAIHRNRGAYRVSRS